MNLVQSSAKTSSDFQINNPVINLDRVEYFQKTKLFENNKNVPTIIFCFSGKLVYWKYNQDDIDLRDTDYEYLLNFNVF